VKEERHQEGKSRQQNQPEKDPGRTPGQAEGTKDLNQQGDPVLDAGRTPGQAEGEAVYGDDYAYQRRQVRQNLGNGNSHDDQTTANLQARLGKVRSGLESGWQRFNQSLNEGGTAAQMRDQFQSLAGDQEFSSAEIKRWLAMIGGGFLAFHGLRRSLGSLSLAGIGAAIFYWGYSGKSPLSLLQTQGQTTHRNAEERIRNGDTARTFSLTAEPKLVTKSIIVKADVKEIFEVWSNFENFPHFMQHIKSVKKMGDDYSRWVMEGPLGARFEWEAKTTRMEQNKRIGWNSTQGDIKTSGQVTFNSLPNNQTEVTVTLQYIPPAGIAGEVVAALFSNPERQLDEDLRNFKRFVEKK
jgi:uncharacterized membrane protein